MNKRKTVALALLLIPLLALWPAGTKEPAASSGTPAIEAAETSGSGSSVEPVRIISCGKGFALVLNAIYLFPESLDSLVAVGKTSQISGNFSAYLDPRFPEKALLGMEANAEEIAAFKPDYVILKSYLTKSLGAQLEALDIPVLYVDLENAEQYSRDLKAIGDIIGNPERAAELVSYFEKKREAVIQKTSSLAQSARPRVLFLYYNAKGGANSFNIPPADWLQTLMFEWAGGTPVWTEGTASSLVATGWTEVGFEQIAAWNPEYIFLVSYHTPVADIKNVLLADSRWQQLDAVKKGRLLSFPGDYMSWDQPDPRWILGLYWILNTLHPDLLSDADIDREVKEFFTFAWNISPEAVQKDIMPRIFGDYR